MAVFQGVAFQIFMITKERVSNLITQSNYISRDLSWLRFNYRVLDQAKSAKRTIFEQLKFLSITASNLDEFFMIRVGSLYNYLDYNKERVDYSGLREKPYRKLLLQESQQFYEAQKQLYKEELLPDFAKNGFQLLGIDSLNEEEQAEVSRYFMKTIFPMLTPMVYDSYHTFPTLANKTLIFGVVTRSNENGKDEKKLSFVQVPQNLPRFYEIDRDEEIVFLPIEEIIRWKVDKLYRNIEIAAVSLFRITRNGDITIEESDDVEDEFIDEIKRKVRTRKTGRVVRVEIEPNYSDWMMKILKKRWEIDDDNIFIAEKIIDYTGLLYIVGHTEFADKQNILPPTSLPIGLDEPDMDMFEFLKTRDILLHHPYNTMEPLLQLMERAAEDPDVLAIKITIYRLAKNSRITNALLKAAENGKHVSVLFELKARFDEENNIREAERLQKAGCFVIHGINRYKTHTKMALIVRKEEDGVARYVHLSSGNYNEATSRFYTDLGLLTANPAYGHDVSEFFNVITGHSQPLKYKNLITSPRDMRNQLIQLIQNETQNALNGLNSGIVIKINSLEDQFIIDELYKASQAGVRIELIVRGICCIRPQRVGLSENITVRSIVGDLLEHSRIFYFQNEEDPKIYIGSADMMVRSFDRRIESLNLITDENVKQQLTSILRYNLKDNYNAYFMSEEGDYAKRKLNRGEHYFNIHKEFFEMYQAKTLLKKGDLFPEKPERSEVNDEASS
jgi:polyphosphate kinase